MSYSNEETADVRQKQAGRWTKEQHLRFLEGLLIFGKNWKKIQAVVKTRTGSQIRSHAQKHFNKQTDRTKNYEKLRKSSEQFQSQHGMKENTQSFSHLGFLPNQNTILDVNQPSTNAVFENLLTFILATSNKLENPRDSAYFIEIIKKSQRQDSGNFIQTYVDIQSERNEMSENDQAPRRKTSFVRFVNENQETA